MISQLSIDYNKQYSFCSYESGGGDETASGAAAGNPMAQLLWIVLWMYQ